MDVAVAPEGHEIQPASSPHHKGLTATVDCQNNNVMDLSEGQGSWKGGELVKAGLK